METKKTLLTFIAAHIITASLVYSQTEGYQDSARPLGLDVAGPVMLAGSDEASAEFQTNELPTLMQFVDTNLSESQALENVSAVSLDPAELILYHDSNVRTYFLSEGAGYRNTLGYTTTGVIDEGALIYPDASSAYTPPYQDTSSTENLPRDNNTPLGPGDFVDLGMHEQGTQLDFFLIADGANGGNNIYGADGLEGANPDGLQHMVAFAVPDSPYLLLGFEDLYGGGDLDYNDIVFVIDIGEVNVQNLVAAPEPAFWMMMALVGATGVWFYHRSNTSDPNDHICSS